MRTCDNNIDEGHAASFMSCSDEESASVSEDADLLEDRNVPRGIRMKKFKSKSVRMSQRRYRQLNQIHRGVRRMIRLVLFALLMPIFLLLMLYFPIYSNVSNRQLPLSDWTYNTSRNIADYVLPTENTTLISPRDMCRDNVFLIIIVCSGLNNFDQRQAIRETWGNTTEFGYNAFTKLHAHLKGHYLEVAPERTHTYNAFMQGMPGNRVPTVRVVFLLGRSKYESLVGNETLTRLHNEAEQFNDIIQENFMDSYNNLTVKSVLALKYMANNCLERAAFFMKCDDDTFVNVPNLLHFLLGGTVPLYNDTLEFYDQLTYLVMSPRNRLNATSSLLLGHLFCTSHPVNDVNSKWYMPYYMYPKNAYPKYFSGAGYLMSMDVVQRIYEVALNTSLIYLEDVYLTGICAETAQLKHRHQPLFSYTRSRRWCTFKGIITQHGMKDDSMVEAWRFVSNYSIHCPPPAPYFKQLRLRHRINC